ncbi:FecR family protein [Caulobacter endophyticus]|uniref:FecR family protein n=1 Tax=Caulobacter endophyticus TaxID=2172652 RepID=UPI00240EDDF7|nr:FecR domain-containing protein [Caulobacter endophyticus]MDG2527219.1 FecR domain-containing protein [Caulobacter endophyticus]
MVREVTPFRPPARDAEADAFVAARLGEEQGGNAAPRLEVGQIADVWDALGQLEAEDFAVEEARPSVQHFVSRRAWITGGAIAAGLAAGGVLVWRGQPVVYETAVGERRTLALPDGSRVTLNTATRLSARFGGGRRQIVLERGEAFFDVAHDQGAPFDVLSDGARVRVTGTRFNVYRQAGFTEVVLLQGGVEVGPANGPQAYPATRLRAGQSVRVSPEGQTDPVVAAQAGRIDDWRQGRVSFNRTPLAVACAEMNRYSRTPLHIRTPALESLEIDGVFEAGDTAAFAKAMARLHGVSVRSDDGALILSRRS